MVKANHALSNSALVVRNSVWTEQKYWTFSCERHVQSNFSASRKFVRCRMNVDLRCVSWGKTPIKILESRAVIKGRGPGISPGYYEHLPRLLSKENKRKIEPKEIPSCLIPCLLVVFTRQLEILVTTLLNPKTVSTIFLYDKKLCSGSVH